ncbi:hypothetical protein CUZ56_00266 [Saezia sanguinis]|uniref:Uncharacterized protein n=2 Tax=Saezia sanguinis TaxID=1965230 RepID=A0A433SGB0_9BURK|nr:hypothetical protein CUZ56_00266 [Saezia sanguinis]
MNLELNDDLSGMLSQTFGQIIQEFNLRVVGIDAGAAFLVGKGYALRFIQEQYELGDISYVERDKKNKLIRYGLGNLFFDRFSKNNTDFDGVYLNKKERILHTLNTYSKQMYKNCQDLFKGEKFWLRREGWRIGELNSKEKKIIEKYM